MLSDAEKLAKIQDICHHPGSYGWSGRKIADFICRVIVGEDQPIPYLLSDDAHYELAHDAVYEEQAEGDP